MVNGGPGATANDIAVHPRPVHSTYRLERSRELGARSQVELVGLIAGLEHLFPLDGLAPSACKEGVRPELVGRCEFEDDCELFAGHARFPQALDCCAVVFTGLCITEIAAGP